jgi:hypothetical protein
MLNKELIDNINKFVTKMNKDVLAHTIDHGTRVKNWALQIAKDQKYTDYNTVAAAALMHDVGLSKVEKRKDHGRKGSEIAIRFLKKQKFFTNEQLSEISNAIEYHCTNREGSGELLQIIRDADMLDLMGAIGITRGCACHASKTEVDMTNPKGETWNHGAKDYDRRFDQGLGTGSSLVDQINFQISCFDNMTTKSGKKFAKPLVKYMKNHILQIEKELIRGSKEIF